MGCIYKITNLVNNKVYIGQTSRSIETRWSEHLRHGFNKNNSEYNRHLYKSMRKYGKDSFVIELIENCENDLMNEREKFWIKFYNSSNSDFGYNLTFGGEGTILIDYEEVYRRYDSGESAGKISKDMNISRSNLTQILKGYDKYDKKATWERAQQEVSIKKGTPVSQYDLDGNFIATYQSAKAAERSVEKTTHANIRKSCVNKRCLSGGFQWRFADDDPPGAYTGRVTHVNKAVCQLDIDRRLISIFKSMNAASDATGIDPSSISKCCSNYRNYSTAGGYIWCYADSYKEGVS